MFAFVAGEDHAHGDVLMTVDAAVPGGRPRRLGFEHWDDLRTQSEFLSIRLVKVDRATVRGELDVYWDPDRGCWASTVFEGQLVNNVISGRFRTKFSLPLAEVEGRWNVTRRSESARRTPGERD